MTCSTIEMGPVMLSSKRRTDDQIPYWVVNFTVYEYIVIKVRDKGGVDIRREAKYEGEYRDFKTDQLV